MRSNVSRLAHAMTDDPLDPHVALETFMVGPWQVTVRQHVTGGLFWIAVRSHPRDVRRADLPVGFTITAARVDAETALRGST
jgi:hypothetical protein